MTGSIPHIPENAPFTGEQRAWLNGYLAGLFSNGNATAAGSAAPSLSLGSLLFLFGSQTGTAEGLARRFAKESKKRGYETRVVGLEDYASLDWKTEKRIVLLTSTYGDGEMPDNAQAFWDFLKTDQAPRLDHLEFSVLSLGDLNYTQFCEAGKLFDQRFETLGGKRIAPRADCDVDYEKPATAWFGDVLSSLEGQPAAVPEAAAAQAEDPAPVAASSFGKSNPFPAHLKTNRLLNAAGSAKETRHFEIVLAGSGLEYEVGDALGVVPRNCPNFVTEILDAAGLSGTELVKVPDGTAMELRRALIEKFDLKPFLAALPDKSPDATTFAAPLRKLQPRLYSISSSPKAHPGEVHLTVGIVRYELEGLARKGVCSTYLAERVGAEDAVSVFVHKSPAFKLPADHSRPIIMVGPGTGIAPFRAFLEERRATDASGKNWLFFGDQRAESDFLYRDELEEFKSAGFLHRLDLAFSRDQTKKIYVQDRMKESATELWAWLQEGAYFYVCGDAKRMAKDVDAALHEVIQTAGELSEAAAGEFVKQLKTEKRYLRDVY